MALHDSMVRTFLEPLTHRASEADIATIDVATKLVELAREAAWLAVALLIVLLLFRTYIVGPYLIRKWMHGVSSGDEENRAEIRALREKLKEQTAAQEARAAVQARAAAQEVRAAVQEALKLNTSNVDRWYSVEHVPSASKMRVAQRVRPIEELYEIYDLLTPMEVALLTFTSAQTLIPDDSNEQVQSRYVIGTAKEAYLWAGAIACVLERRSTIPTSQILESMNSALKDLVSRNLSSFSGQSIELVSSDNHVRMIDQFVSSLDVHISFEDIEKRTNQAYQTLLWLGLVEDPFWKEVSGKLLAVALLTPVQFTSGPADFSINALSWQYVVHDDGAQVQRQFKLRVKEVSKAVMEEMVPGAVKIINELSESPSHEQEHGASAVPVASAPIKIPLVQLQLALRKAGYDVGAIDGKFGKQTQSALSQFQSDRRLPVTGRPDQETIFALNLGASER